MRSPAVYGDVIDVSINIEQHEERDIEADIEACLDMNPAESSALERIPALEPTNSSEERLFLLQCACERNSLLRGNELDRQLKWIEGGVNQTGALSGLYTSKPVSTTLVRRPAKFFIVVLMLYLIVFIWQLCFRIDTDFGDEVDKYLSLRVMSDSNSTFIERSIDQFGATFNGFALTPDSQTVKEERLVLEFSSDILVNGFFLNFESDSIRADFPSGIEVSRSSDGETWEPIYRNSCWLAASEHPHKISGGLLVDAFETWAPPARKWCYIFALAWLVAAELTAGFGCLWLLYCRRVAHAKHSFVFGTFATMTCWFLISAVPWKTECLFSWYSVFYMVTNVIWCIMGAWLAIALRNEANVIRVLATFGLTGSIHCIAQLLDPISENATRVASFAALLLMNLSFSLVPCFSWLFMRRHQAQAQRLVADDMARYRAVWARLQEASNLRHVQEISEITCRLMLRARGALVQHLNRQGLIDPHMGQDGSFVLPRSFSTAEARTTSVFSSCFGRCTGPSASAKGDPQAEGSTSELRELRLSRLSGASHESVSPANPSLRISDEPVDGPGAPASGNVTGSVTVAASGKRPGSVNLKSSSTRAPCPGDRWEEALDQLATTYPDGMGRGIAGTRDPRYPVQSLDQLYLQACALHPVFIGLVRSWAGASGGLLSSAKRRKHASTSSLTLDPSVCTNDGSASEGTGDMVVPKEAGEQDIRWAKLKSTGRAIEKAVRSYKGDVSLVVDICRQSIVFPDLAKLVACIKAIEADERVRVLRVKNRLDPSYDDSMSAGYRDVALNLLVVTDETVRMGVETHVCELQLIPIDMHRLKTEQGHARYVSFRNMRAE